MQVEKNNYNKKGLMISKTGNIKNKDNKYPTQEIKYVNNLINKVIDYNNNSIVYNYDFNNENLLSISTSVDGINNANTFKYNYGLLTEINGSNKIEYIYDGNRRIAKIKLNSIDYLENLYEENKDGTIITTYKAEEKRVNVTKNNKPIYQQILNNEGEEIINYSYDEKERLKEITYNQPEKNKLIKETYEYSINNIISYKKEENDNLILLMQNEYDKSYYLTSTTYNLINDLIKEKYQYNDKHQITKINSLINNNEVISNIKYDALNRVKHQEINNNKINICQSYSYLQQDENSLNLISEETLKINLSNNSYYIETNKYDYDENSNIISIKDDETIIKYKYDSLNRLIEEINPKLNKKITYQYNEIGNINLIKEYNNQTNEIINTKEYIYDCEYKDILLSINNDEIQYDNLFRPILYKGNNLKWDNDKLLKINDNIIYEYDEKGIRNKKIINNEETTYILNNNQILQMSNNKGKINFRYILNKLVGFDYTSSSGTKSYLYIRNILGDITSIIDSEGNIICSYIYDGFGNHIVLNQENKVDLELNSIGHINPFRYRGYYYDEETGLYYLNSRYYDPSTCRFISPDNIEYLDPNSINGLNLYTYCGNNPIMYVDPSGHMTKWLAWVISSVEIVVGITLTFIPGCQMIGSTLIGTGIGSLINGYINESNGGSFNAGWYGGQISAIFSLIPGVGIPLTAFFGSIISDSIDYGWNHVDLSKAFITSFFAWGFSLFPGMIGEFIDKYKIYETAIYLVNTYNTILASTANSVVNVYWRNKIEKRRTL